MNPLFICSARYCQFLQVLVLSFISILQMLPAITWAVIALLFLPVANAIPEEMPFPDISWIEFS
jgi:hypothetical protein